MGLSTEHLTDSLKPLMQLDADAQLEHLLDYVRKQRIVPPQMTLNEFRRLFLTFKADVQATRTYQPQSYPGRITLFSAQDGLRQKKVRGRQNGWGVFTLVETRIRSATANEGDPTMGWSRLAAGGVEVVTVPGNHYTILKQPQVQTVAQQLNECLNQAATAEFVHGS